MTQSQKTTTTKEEDLETKELGFIQLSRNLKNDPIYSDSEYLHVFLHIMLNVNFKRKVSNGTVVNPGQLKTGRLSLSNSTGLSASKIERVLTFLEDNGYIQQQKTTKYRLISLVSGDYTINSGQQTTASEQQADSNWTASEQQADTTNKVNKVKNANKVKKVNKVFVAPSFSEVEEYAISRNRTDLSKKFFDFFDAGDWIDSQGNSVKNWKQKFVSWEGRNPAPNSTVNAVGKVDMMACPKRVEPPLEDLRADYIASGHTEAEADEYIEFTKQNRSR